ALAYPDLLAAARAVMAEFGVAARIDEAALRDALFRLVMVHGVMPTVCAAASADDPGERPRAHALARLQAASPGWVVSGARHVAIDLDAAGRLLLGLLDGRHTSDELAALMQQALAGQGLDVPPQSAAALTQRQLWLFARQGLLAG
ncbi:MAG TPA: hypothetical protein VKO83_01660, partial [Steroidobacteraceae bacterium]|nr:hypothetical protein [Steroidobacteraceae bacterium]